MFGLSSSLQSNDSDSDCSSGDVIDEQRLALWRQQYILRSGFMTKQGAIAKTWKRRYFELLNNGELVYYRDMNKIDKNALGVLNMENVKSIQLLELPNGFGFSLETIIDSKKTTKRIWYFVCDSKHCRNEWHTVILKLLTLNRKKKHKQLNFNNNKSKNNIFKNKNNRNNRNNKNKGKENDSGVMYDIATNYKTISKDLGMLEKNWLKNFESRIEYFKENGISSIEQAKDMKQIKQMRQMRKITQAKNILNSNNSNNSSGGYDTTFLKDVRQFKISLRLFEQQLIYVNGKARDEIVSIDDSYVIFERLRLLSDELRQAMIDIDVVIHNEDELRKQMKQERVECKQGGSISSFISSDGSNTVSSPVCISGGSSLLGCNSNGINGLNGLNDRSFSESIDNCYYNDKHSNKRTNFKELHRIQNTLNSDNTLIECNSLECNFDKILGNKIDKNKNKSINSNIYNVKVYRNSIQIYYCVNSCIFEWRYGDIDSIRKHRFHIGNKNTNTNKNKNRNKNSGKDKHEIKMKNKSSNELCLLFNEQSIAQEWYNILVESIRPFHKRPKKNIQNTIDNKENKENENENDAKKNENNMNRMNQMSRMNDIMYSSINGAKSDDMWNADQSLTTAADRASDDDDDDDNDNVQDID